MIKIILQISFIYFIFYYLFYIGLFKPLNNPNINLLCLINKLCNKFNLKIIMTDRPSSADARMRATDLNAKSMLQSKMDNRMTGTKFFQDNKVRTSSYIIQNGTNYSAVPFY